MPISRLSRPVLGALAGGVVAAFLIGIGLLRALFAMAGGRSVHLTGAFPELLAYETSFVVSGALVGALWPVRKYAVGRVGIWILGMAVVVLAIMRMEEGPFSAWSTGDVWLSVVLTVLFGLAAAFGFERA